MRAPVTTFEQRLRQQAVDLFIVTVLVPPIIIALPATYLLWNEATSNVIYFAVGTGVTGLWSTLLFTSAFNIRGERGIAAASQAIVGCSLADLTPFLLGEVGTTPFFFPFGYLILGASRYRPHAEALRDLCKTREPAAWGQPCCGQERRETFQSLSAPPETRRRSRCQSPESLMPGYSVRAQTLRGLT